VKYPTSLAIYLDTGCNLRCSFCLYKGRNGTPLNFDIRNLTKISTAIEKAKVVCISAWGEPLMSPQLYPTLDYIYTHNKRDNLIAIVTNGTLLDAGIARRLTGHLGELVVSMNAGTTETYQRDMHGDWQETLSAVRRFMAALTASDRDKIGLHMVAHSGNVNEMAALVRVAGMLNIRRVRVDQMMAASRDQIPLAIVSVKDEYQEAVREAEGIASAYGIIFTARDFGYVPGH
jgi:MoaA/NifB/PqqE/SkfB family radical SAM enzyme